MTKEKYGSGYTFTVSRLRITIVMSELISPEIFRYLDSCEIFEQAIKGFRNSLSDAERSVFLEWSNPKEIITLQRFVMKIVEAKG